MRTVFFVSVARSLISERKLWAGRPSSVCLRRGLRSAAWERVAGATTDEMRATVVSGSWSVKRMVEIACRAGHKSYLAKTMPMQGIPYTEIRFFPTPDPWVRVAW